MESNSKGFWDGRQEYLDTRWPWEGKRLPEAGCDGEGHSRLLRGDSCL